jgi:hypothetical protein
VVSFLLTLPLKSFMQSSSSHACYLPYLQDSQYEGRATAQPILADAVRVRSQVRSCRICGGRSGTRAGIVRVLQFLLPIFIPPAAPYSFIYHRCRIVLTPTTSVNNQLHLERTQKRRTSESNSCNGSNKYLFIYEAYETLKTSSDLCPLLRSYYSQEKFLPQRI